MEKKKTKKWIRFRHRVVIGILRHTLGIYTRLKYHIKIDKFKNQGKRQYLVLFNHQTAFDQFFVSMAFRGHIYYLASEDLFSNGKLSALIKFLVAPIPIKKQSTDVHAIINWMKVAKEGGTIGMAPEGNRTYSGETSYINPTVAPLARKLGLPIVLFKIEGGYGAHPRWADKVRRGKMHAYVSRVVEPEEYASMTNDELYELIKSELYVNEAKEDVEFKRKNLAENLERAVYVCRNCGLSSFKTDANFIECKKCGERIEYLPSKKLRSEKADFPFEFFLDWYKYQHNYVNELDTRTLCDKPIYTDTARFSEIIPHKDKIVLKESASINLYGDRITINDGEADEECFRFEELTGASVLGKNKLNIYKKNQTYQFKGDKSFCALKYVNILHRHKNLTQGKEESFLGL